MKKVVWDILSTAKIGIDLVLPAMRDSPLIDVRAIASHSLAAAQRAARGADAIAQMRVIDALWRSEQGGRWETVAACPVLARPDARR